MATADKSSAALTDLEYAIQLIMTGKKDPEFTARVQAETSRSPKKFGANTAS